MAGTSGKQYSVGARQARIYPLDSNGRIAATSTTVYEGLQIVGKRAFEVTVPDARRIVHIGDDAIKAQDMLPRQEASSAVLRASRLDHDVHAALTGQLAFTIGEAAMIGYATDKQGSEPEVGLLCFQQSLDAVSKLRRYRAYILPLVRAVVPPSSMNESPNEQLYNITPQVVSKHIWGVAFAVGTEGFSEAEVLEGMYEDYPHIVAWKGDGAAVDFLFHTSRPAVATTKIHMVTEQDVDVTATVTKAVDKITFAVAPTSGDIIVCEYEYAD